MGKRDLSASGGKIILILLIAFGLRLVNLSQSLWLDEGAQVLMAEKSLGFQWFGRGTDFQPPLYYFIIHFWLKLGRSEWFLRLPSVFFGVATVYLVYLLGKRIFNEKIGLISALFLALAPYHIYYSQELRMYSLLVFLATASMLFLVEKNWLGYILTTTALLYTHYSGFFLILAQIVYIFFWQKKILPRLFKNLFLTFLLFLPWLPQFFKQLKAGSNLVSLLPSWQEVANLPVIKAFPLTFIKFSLGRISFYDKGVYALVFILVGFFYGYLFFQALKKISREKIFLLCWLLLPILAALTISLFIPMYQPFRIIFTLVPFYLLLSLGILSLRKKHHSLGIILVLAISLFGLFVYYFNPRFHRENWREVTAFIESQNPDDAVAIFKFSEPFAPYQWYSWGRVKAVGVLPGLRATSQVVEVKMPEVTKEKKEIYLFEYLGGLTDPESLVDNWLLENGFEKKETKDFSGVGFIYNYSNK